MKVNLTSRKMTARFESRVFEDAANLNIASTIGIDVISETWTEHDHNMWFPNQLPEEHRLNQPFKKQWYYI